MKQISFEKIKEILTNSNEVIFGYVFGSGRSGEISPISDLDIAIYLKPELAKEEKKRIIEEIREKLEKEFDLFDKVDVVLLNQELPFLLLKEIVYQGILVFSRNDDWRKLWEAKMISLWLDWQYYQKAYEKAILEE